MNLAQIDSLVLVGAGKMGMALARGWLKSGLKAKNLILIDPKPAQSVIDFAKENDVSLLKEIPKILVQVLILAVKPQIMQKVFTPIKAIINDETLVLSIAGGITISALINGLGTNNIVRTMPNTPAQVGQGVTGAVAAFGVSEKDKNIAQALMQASGLVQWFENEDDLEALTLVSGCGPAYVFLLAEAMANAGIEQGLNQKQAKILARQTIIGAAALMQNDPTDAAILRKNVTSKGGITEAALSVLMDKNGLSSLMSKAFIAGAKRNKDLGK